MIDNILKSRFGYDSFRPLQEEIIQHVLGGKDSLVLMPTGGGKSLCYQLPALCFDGTTLVVSPLIALMKDQVDALNANGIPAAFINSSLNAAEIGRIQSTAVTGQTKILYVAPERLATANFRAFLNSVDVSMIAIDEAHCISEWGHDFRPDYRNLKALRRRFPHVPVMALTATATERVREDILDQLDIRNGNTFLSSFNRDNLTYVVQPKRNAFDALVQLLRKHRDESAIIYCFSRKGTEELVADLKHEGFAAAAYHAGLEPPVRRDTQEKFIRDEVPIIVATIAFGMGIDKPDIRLIVHYNLPKSLEGYYQETGRAGRDGLPSECVLFFTLADKSKQEFFIDQMEGSKERKGAQEKLDEMVEYCDLTTCRRAYVLQYFGEQWEIENCGGCDVCMAGVEEFDATTIAQQILSAVIRLNEHFGINHVVGVLRGSRAKKIIDLEHEQLSVYGLARDISKEEIKRIARMLIDRGFLATADGEYPTLLVPAAGREFLRNRDSLQLTRLKKREDTAPGSETSHLDYDQGLFTILRDLRRMLAEEQNVPPYIVFGDLSLVQMAHFAPQSEQSFSRISGVGTTKLEQYGKTFIDHIRRYANEHGLEEREPPTERRASRAVGRPGSTYSKTLEFFRQGLRLDDIAVQRNLNERTILAHLERLAANGEDIDVSHMLEPERYERIRQELEQAGRSWLTPIIESLGDGYSYEEVRLARLQLLRKAE